MSENTIVFSPPSSVAPSPTAQEAQKPAPSSSKAMEMANEIIGDAEIEHDGHTATEVRITMGLVYGPLRRGMPNHLRAIEATVTFDDVGFTAEEPDTDSAHQYTPEGGRVTGFMVMSGMTPSYPVPEMLKDADLCEALVLVAELHITQQDPPSAAELRDADRQDWEGV